MHHQRPTIAEIASAASALWDRARTLLIAEPFDPDAARDMKPQLLAWSEQARVAGLDRTWKELRKAAKDMDDATKQAEKDAKKRRT